MRVLVTGASGMLGAGVARALAARGDRVTVLQRRASGLGLAEVRADVTDAAAVRRAVDGHDGVVHLAAKVDVFGRWPDFERVNVGGTANLIAACRDAGVPRLVQVSSPSVAHAGRSIVGADAAPADPDAARGPYARSKAAAELLALGAADDRLAVTAVRPHLVWGPDDPQFTGRLVARAHAGRVPILGSGAALADFTYVDNAVDALLAALDRCTEVSGQAFVVTNAEPRPIAEMFALICAAAGAPAPGPRVPVGVAMAAGSVMQTVWPRTQEPPITRFLAEQLSTAHWFDQRRTRDALRWTPRVSLAEGLERLARWYTSELSASRAVRACRDADNSG